jgi:hypothetical protein
MPDDDGGSGTLRRVLRLGRKEPLERTWRTDSGADLWVGGVGESGVGDKEMDRNANAGLSIK